MNEIVGAVGEGGAFGVLAYFLWFFIKKYEAERKYNAERDEQNTQIIVGLIKFLLQKDGRNGKGKSPFDSKDFD